MLDRLSASRAFEACLVAAILILGGVYFLSPSGEFDRARWLADPGSGARATMVDDLIARYRLKGRPRQQIVELLGPPTRTERWPERELTYSLGRREWLLFDIAGTRVRDHRVVHESAP